MSTITDMLHLETMSDTAYLLRNEIHRVAELRAKANPIATMLLNKALAEAHEALRTGRRQEYHIHVLRSVVTP